MKKDWKWLTRAVGELAENACERMAAAGSMAGETAAQWYTQAAGWTSAALKRAAEAVKKPPEVKNVLLQTYFTSLLCLVLCVSMFLGTSYAWFTSEVDNNANEIYIGTLDVELEKRSGEKWDSLSAVQDGKSTASLFDGSIFWEPGYTTLETIRVVNEGNLAFKYVLSFTEGTVEPDEAIAPEQAVGLEAVAAYFDVWVFDHAQEGGNTAPASYAELTAAESGWVHAGTLDRILAGKTVLEGKMDAPAAAAQETEGQAEKTGDTYTIALHMNDAADAAVMGHKISLNVKLIAYQSTSETDGFGTGAYDDGITAVSELETLQAALAAEGVNILLAGDVEIGDAAERLTMTGGILDGHSGAIRYTVDKTEGAASQGVLTIAGGTVRNLTIEAGDAGRALCAADLKADLTVSNCKLSGDWAFTLDGAEETEFAVACVNTRFDSRVACADVAKELMFSDCEFARSLKLCGSATLTNCTFATAGLNLSALAAGEQVTLVNCTYEGTVIDQAVLTAAEDGTVTVKCESGVIALSEDEMVILSSNG